MAPEVLEGSYSKGADVWSCGIILFCMLFGFPPFYVDESTIHMDEAAELERLIRGGFTPEIKPGFGPWFPETVPVSENCRVLLSKMLKTDVSRRWTVKECLGSKWICGECGSEPLPLLVREALVYVFSPLYIEICKPLSY